MVKQILTKDWADYRFFLKLREDLKALPEGQKVELACYSEGEAKWIHDQLTEVERAKIARYTWENFADDEKC